ncbi:hypothetical protein ACFLQU_03230 [Verrucomicrobiota bacterium]
MKLLQDKSINFVATDKSRPMLEKTRRNVARLGDEKRYIDLYYNFKRRNRYSDLEIAKKRQALENVLIPYRVEENMELLKRNGFDMIDMFFRWYNFACFIGVKTKGRFPK